MKLFSVFDFWNADDGPGTFLPAPDIEFPYLETLPAKTLYPFAAGDFDVTINYHHSHRALNHHAGRTTKFYSWMITGM
jgi:hypothetical protein